MSRERTAGRRPAVRLPSPALLPRAADPRFVAGALLALGAACGYGINIVTARMAALEGVSGPSLVLVRNGAVLLGFLAIAAWRARPLLVARADRAPLLALGLASGLLGLAYISSVSFIPATVAAIVFYTYPVLILLAAPFVYRGRLDPARLVAAIAALAGIALVLGPSLTGLDPRGLALAAAASMFTAAQFFVASRCGSVEPVAKIVVIQAIGVPLALTVGLLSGTLMWPVEVFARAPLAVLVTILGAVVGLTLHLAALSRLDPGTAGLLFCLEPVVAALAAALLLGERLGGLQLAGGALVLGIVAATMLGEARARASP